MGSAVLIAMAFTAAPARAFTATEGVAQTVDFAVDLPCPLNSNGETFNCAQTVAGTMPPIPSMPASAAMTITWGDGGTSTATATTDVTVCRSLANSQDFGFCEYDASVSHTYAEETPATMPDPVSATIEFNGVARKDFGNTSATVNDATPTVSNLGGTGVEGSTQAVTLAQLSDPGGVSTTTYTVSITWGDGSPVDNATGAVSGGGAVTGSHAYAHAGRYTAQVNVKDDGGASTSFQSAITVLDQSLNATGVTGLTATEGTPLTGVKLAHFTDGNPLAVAADYAATVDWGDGSSSAGTVSAPPGGGFDVTASHIYLRAGPQTPVVTIVDDGGATATAHAGVTVSDTALVAHPVSGVIATEGASNLVNVATFVDPGGSLTASDFSASIDWGDGTTSPGAVSAPASPGGAFTVSAQHTYGEEGTWPAKVTITDVSGGATSSVTTTVAVSDAVLAASGAGTLHFQEGVSGGAVALATFKDADPSAAASDFTATVDWGDGTAATPATVSSAAGGTLAVTSAHAYAEEGRFTARVAIMDAGGATVSSTTAVIVADRPLTATPIATLRAVAHAPTGTVTVASFADGDPGGTANDYAATINWGDGSGAHAGTIATGPGGRFAVVGAHTYGGKGTFHVQIRITDSGGAAAFVTSTESVAPARLQSALGYQFTFSPSFTRFTSLVARAAPVGGQIKLGCKGNGCGRRALTIAVVATKCKHARCHSATATTVDLAPLVQGWRLAPGAQLTVEILRRGWIGKYYAFHIRRNAPPAVLSTCIAPGARTAGVGC